MSSLLQSVKGLLGKAGSALGLSGNGTGKDDEGQTNALSFTQRMWDDLKNAYVVYHQSIWQAILMYANQTWIEWDDARKVWQPQQPSDDWVPRPRINRFSPTVDAVCSNFFKIPEVDVEPSPDDDPVAMQVTNVCNKYLDYFFTTNGLHGPYKTVKDKSGVAAQLFVLAGGVMTNVYPFRKKIGTSPVPGAPVPGISATCPKCDTVTPMPAPPEGMSPPETCPQCGGPLQVERTQIPGEPELGEDGNPKTEDQYEYCIHCDIENMLYAIPRPGALDLDDSPYFLLAKRKTLDDIFFRWDGFDASADSIWPDGYSVTYEHALNFWYTGYSSSTIVAKDSCMTLQMYVPPSHVKDFPNGFYCVSINDKAAHYEEWQFPEHPITIGGYLDMPTLFVARSVAFDLAEIQRELNAYESIIKLHAMTSASDPIVIDANTLVGEITGRADKFIKWRSVSPNSKEPHRMESGHLDDGVYKQRDNLHAEFQNISMAVNAFRGEQEGAIVAASAIQQLRGQAEQMFSKPQENWSSLWKETGRKALKFAQKYLTNVQLVAICGPGSTADIMQFKKADLDKCITVLASQHGMPRTRDERKSEMMTMWDKGALDINQPDVRQRIYELFGETGMMKSFNLDATRARLENQAMKENGQVLQPMVGIEDLGIHLFIHTSRVKSLEFDQWKPEAKQALMQHIQLTNQALEQQQIKQAQMAAMQQKTQDAGKSNAQIHGSAGATASAATPPKKSEQKGPGGPPASA
jgi:hypothetical protein